MKKLPASIIATVVLAVVEMVSAQQPPSISQTLVGQPKSNLQTDFEMANIEWLLAHPDKKISNLDTNDPEFQILLAKDQGLSSEDRAKKSADDQIDLQALMKGQNEDAQVGQQGSSNPNTPLPPNGGPPVDGTPVSQWSGWQNPGSTGYQQPMNGIGANISASGTWTTHWGGNNNNNRKSGGNSGNGSSGNGSSSGGSGNSQNSSTGNVGGNSASWYVSQACPMLHQTALTYYQDYQADRQTTANMLSQAAAAANVVTAALDKIVLADLQAGKSAAQIGDDLCNYYSQHLNQFVNGAGNVGAGAGVYNAMKPAPLQQTVTQPTPVAMPGY